MAKKALIYKLQQINFQNELWELRTPTIGKKGIKELLAWKEISADLFKEKKEDYLGTISIS